MPLIIGYSCTSTSFKVQEPNGAHARQNEGPFLKERIPVWLLLPLAFFLQIAQALPDGL
jgi:hypothetical protein